MANINLYSKEQTDTLLSGKQDTLVSGTNIKTVNNQSLLGSGNVNIEIPVITIDDELSGTSTNPVQNRVINTALDGKQPTLVSGTNIKTVNNQPLLGTGNISIPVITVDSAISGTSQNPVQNQAIKNALDGKQNNITINLVDNSYYQMTY